MIQKLYGDNGCSSEICLSFTQNCYIISCTDNVNRSEELLRNIVFHNKKTLQRFVKQKKRGYEHGKS